MEKQKSAYEHSILAERDVEICELKDKNIADNREWRSASMTRELHTQWLHSRSSTYFQQKKNNGIYCNSSHIHIIIFIFNHRNVHHPLVVLITCVYFIASFKNSHFSSQNISVSTPIFSHIPPWTCLTLVVNLRNVKFENKKIACIIEISTRILVKQC